MVSVAMLVKIFYVDLFNHALLFISNLLAFIIIVLKRVYCQ